MKGIYATVYVDKKKIGYIQAVDQEMEALSAREQKEYDTEKEKE